MLKVYFERKDYYDLTYNFVEKEHFPQSYERE